MEDFKIIECTPEHIVVNREPCNEEELYMMKAATMDAMIRESIVNGEGVQFTE